MRNLQALMLSLMLMFLAPSFSLQEKRSPMPILDHLLGIVGPSVAQIGSSSGVLMSEYGPIVHKAVQGRVSSVSEQVLFTVPAGKTATLFGVLDAYIEGTIGAVTANLYRRDVLASDTLFTATTYGSAGYGNSTSRSSPGILTAGESLVLKVTAQSGDAAFRLNCCWVEFDVADYDPIDVEITTGDVLVLGAVAYDRLYTYRSIIGALNAGAYSGLNHLNPNLVSIAWRYYVCTPGDVLTDGVNQVFGNQSTNTSSPLTFPTSGLTEIFIPAGKALYLKVYSGVPNGHRLRGGLWRVNS